jgi:hypothetical protein
MATESDNINAGALGTLLGVGAFATLCIALVVTALVRTEVSEETDRKDVNGDRAYRDLLADQTAKLAAPATYLDRGRGLVSLPIDRAMEVTVAGLVKDPNSATPPAAVGGSGGASADASGGSAVGGMAAGGSAAGTGGAPATDAATPTDAAKPADEKKDDKKEEKKDAKKEAPKPKPVPVPKAPVPAAPAPAAPAPAPAAPPNP